MSTRKSGGLLIGLCIAWLVAGIAATGGRQAPAAISSTAPVSATAVVTAALPPATRTAPPKAIHNDSGEPTDENRGAAYLEAQGPPLATPGPAAQPASTTPAGALSTASPTTILPATPAFTPNAVPTPTLTVLPELQGGLIVGHSVQERPIVAYRVGSGRFKAALVADVHGEPEANTYRLAQQLLTYFRAHPGEIPDSVSLWIVPTMNPDGLAAGQRWNANGVDLNRNADTDLDGCAGNDWSPDAQGPEGSRTGSGGPYPFSEPETRAIRDFLADAWVAVFYHSAVGAVYVDSCQRHAPTAFLAKAIAAGSGYNLPAQGWSAYPVTGDLGDYFAGEGVASVAVELTDHQELEFERNLAGVRSLLAAMDEIIGAEAASLDADLVWLDETSTGVWGYTANSFVHPLALEVVDTTAYLLDAGRLLALDLATPTAPRQHLVPGDEIQGVRVLEPLDLAADSTLLSVLDRAGDVYLFDPEDGAWGLERYDRPVSSTSDHYYVALAAEQDGIYLLDTTHEQVWRFKGPALSKAGNQQQGTAWLKLPRSRDVDVATVGGDVYVLVRDLAGPAARVLKYREGNLVTGYQARVDLTHPLQLRATSEAVYVLDRTGRRLVALDPVTGVVRDIYQFTDRRAVSAFWVGPSGKRMLLAGRDALYFYGEPDKQATVVGGPALEGGQAHDPALLEALRGLQMPIQGANVSSRDFQLPGAPRHYRLGLHEGLDFYGQTVGVPVNRGTPVHAVADGVVIRALLDYQPLTSAQAVAWASETRRLGYTPPDVLDGYRGMQVWIDHGSGLVSRYAHLGSIATGVLEGATVKKGQVIGTVGNSGTPDSLRGAQYEVHLHLELWVGDHNIGQFLRPLETRVTLERILRWVPSEP